MEDSALKQIQLRMVIEIHLDEFGPLPITLLVLSQITPTGVRGLVKLLVGKFEAGLSKAAHTPGLAARSKCKPKEDAGDGGDVAHSFELGSTMAYQLSDLI